LPSKVDGNILGKSFNATGRRSSMNGTITNTENGIRRNKSVVVRRSYATVDNVMSGEDNVLLF
jgi:hypothetical protein